MGQMNFDQGNPFDLNAQKKKKPLPSWIVPSAIGVGAALLIIGSVSLFALSRKSAAIGSLNGMAGALLGQAPEEDEEEETGGNGLASWIINEGEGKSQSADQDASTVGDSGALAEAAGAFSSMMESGADTSKDAVEGNGSTGDGYGITDVSEEFGVDAYGSGDYSDVLDPAKYLSYRSGTGDFYYFYPAGFFTEVTKDVRNQKADYGSNVETEIFTAPDGSRLTFSLTRREDNMSREDMTQYVYDYEMNKLYDGTKLIHDTTEDHGKVVVTGYTDFAHETLVYDMVKIEDEYVMQMFSTFPAFQGDEDEHEKSYVTECLYRLCGFSDSSKQGCRSYEEYVESVTG